MPAFIDLSGEVFGRLKVVEYAGKNTHKQSLWLCVCDCGNSCTVLANKLKCGDTKSCGCFKSETMKAKFTTHGETSNGKFSREYSAWAAMKTRCSNPNVVAYDRWGGRGIKVCEKWIDDFSAFLEDVGRCPGKGYSLDRWPNQDGNYEPGNVRWATSQQQNENRKNAILVQLNGETICLTEACRRTGTKFRTAMGRRARGWNQEDWLDCG